MEDGIKNKESCRFNAVDFFDAELSRYRRLQGLSEQADDLRHCKAEIVDVCGACDISEVDGR